MKISNLFYIIFVIILSFISSCIKNQSLNEDLEFKQMCIDAGYEWMLMKPIQDGKLIKDVEECWGCMVKGIEHVCNKDNFMEFVPPRSKVIIYWCFCGFASWIGFIVSYIGRGLLQYVGWFDLSIGILLIIIGFIYLFNLNDKINLNKLSTFGEKLKSNKLRNKYFSFFFYGIGFAIASLGCTLPIFLLVVTAAIQQTGIANGMIIFLIYVAGMSFFMILFSVAVALSKTIIEKTLKRWMPYLYKLGALVVIFAGAYLIYNQVVLGRLFAYA